MRLLSYIVLPNHWHLVVWPQRDGELSSYAQWLTVTHVRRWHAHHHSGGTGPVYQGRFKSFPVETDDHFLTVCRYVERNARRANLVARAENWRWSSLWHRCHATQVPWLSDFGVPRGGSPKRERGNEVGECKKNPKCRRGNESCKKSENQPEARARS
jgi:putative transposase